MELSQRDVDRYERMKNIKVDQRLADQGVKAIEEFALFVVMAENRNDPEAIDALVCSIMENTIFKSEPTDEQKITIWRIWETAKEIAKEEGHGHGTD